MQGVAAAGAGVVQDPLAGWRAHAVIGVLFGLMKAVLGLGLRPIAGATEMASKATQGCALVCLGRQGIQGKIMRRVYAPGTARRLNERSTEVRWRLLVKGARAVTKVIAQDIILTAVTRSVLHQTHPILETRPMRQMQSLQFGRSLSELSPAIQNVGVWSGSST